MRRRVGIDIDSVICNIEDNLVKHVIDNWDDSFTIDGFSVFSFSKNENLHPEARKELSRLATDGEFLYKGNVYDDALEAMNKLISKFDIHIITSRPYDKTSTHTMKWLYENKIPFNRVHFSRSGRKCDLMRPHFIKAFIEDNPTEIENILSCVGELPRGLYCVDRPWNRYLNDDRVTRVISLAEAIDLIMK